MANPITWKNVNAPNQGAAVQLARQGSNQLVNSISGLGDTLKTLRDREQADASKLSADKAQALMNQISTFDATKLAETKASGVLSPEALAQSGINNDGIAKILAHAQTQDDRIFAEGQQAVTRDETVRQQEQAAKGRKDNQTVESIIADRELDPYEKVDMLKAVQQNNNIGSDIINKAVSGVLEGADYRKNLTADDQRNLDIELATQQATTDAQIGQLESQLATAKAKLPDAPISRKDPESLIALNEGIDKIRGDDRFWNFLRDDTEEVKQELIKEGEKQGASPNQIIAALGAVADGGGDYDFDAFQERLKEVVDNPELDKLRNRAAGLQDSVNRLRINLPKSQQQQRQAAIDSFLAKAR